MQGRELTGVQTQTLSAIREHLQIHGRAPSRSELAEALGLRHQAAIDARLHALQRKGWIAIEPGVAHGITVLREELAIYGEVPVVPAGAPMLAEDGQPQAEMAAVQTLLRGFEHKPDYFMIVRGDSMDRCGINDGDVVAVRRTPVSREGDIVIARIGDDITMKRYHRAADHIELQPQSMNPEHETITVELDTDDFEIIGVIVGAIIGIRPVLNTALSQHALEVAHLIDGISNDGNYAPVHAGVKLTGDEP